MKKEASLIITNATIYTVDSTFSICTAMAIGNDGKILDTGSDEEILKKYKADSVIDMEKKCVMPGFIDSHCHFYGYCVKVQTMANLKGTKSFEEIVGIMKKHAAEFGGEWITGRGWDQNDWDIKEFPDNSLLNEAFPDKPVVLTRIDGHAVIANDAAIKLINLKPENLPAKDEAITRKGKFTGVFLENTADLFKNAIPKSSKEQAVKGFLKGQADCFGVGLTSVADAGLGWNEVHMIDSLQKADIIKMRVYAMLEPSAANLEKFVKKGIYKTAQLNVRSIKLYADGALGSRGACLLKPYNDDPHNHGIKVTSSDTIKSICEIAYNNGYQVNTHCIGDSANREILKIYADFLKSKNDRRWRIEHAQVVNPDDFHLFGDYNIVPAVQSTHATSDMYWAEQRLGPVRIKSAYAYKQLMQQNGWIPNGTDFPIEEINPIYTFYAAFARKDLKGFPPNGFQAENALSRIDAIRSITIWAAKACFEESEKGSLEKGKLADFVVLDDDILKVSEEKVPMVKVINTYINGRLVYTK
jgi:predicted amidohydrolase YtcJ